MNTNHIRLITIAVALLFFGAEAFAAGSSSQPAQDTRAGVSQYNAGVVLMKKGEYKKAAKQFKAALKKNPNMAKAHNNLGYSLRKQGASNFKRSLSHYNRAIELNPHLAEAYMYRGVLHALMGNEDKALQDHSSLIKLNRRLADALQAAIASGEEPDGMDGLARKW